MVIKLHLHLTFESKECLGTKLVSYVTRYIVDSIVKQKKAKVWCWVRTANADKRTLEVIELRPANRRAIHSHRP